MKKILFILFTFIIAVGAYCQTIYRLPYDTTIIMKNASKGYIKASKGNFFDTLFTVKQKFNDGNEASGKVMTSDANGNISWQVSTGVTAFLPSVDDLRTSSIYLSPTIQGVQTLGYYIANDGGGSTYYWSAGSSATDDGFLVIKPTAVSGSGRWLLQLGSSVNILQAGALADSTTDARPAFKKCLTALAREPLHPTGVLKGAGTIIIPRGKFYFSDSVIIRTTVNIVGIGAGTFPYQETQIWFRGIHGGFYFMESQDGSGGRSCVLQNLYLFSLYADNTQTWHGIFSNTIISLENIAVAGFSGDGYIIDTRDSGNANNSYLVRCHAQDNRRYGFSIWGNDANNLTLYSLDANANGGSGFHDQSFLGNRYFGFHTSFAGVRQPFNKSYVKIGTTIYGAWNPNTGIQPGVTSGWQNYWVQQANVPLNYATIWSADSTYFDAVPFWGMGAASGIDIYGGYAEGGQLGAALGVHAHWHDGTNGAGFIGNYMLWTYADADQFVIHGAGVYNYDGTSPLTYSALTYSNGLEVGSIATKMGILQTKAIEADTTVHVYANSTIVPRISYPLRDLVSHSEFGRDTVLSATPIIQFGGEYFSDVSNTNYITATKRILGGATTPPTDPARQFAAGDFLWNMGSSSDTIGWKCTVTGRPGTWVAVVAGGGGSLFPISGTGTASGDVTGDIGGHIFSIYSNSGTGSMIINNNDPGGAYSRIQNAMSSGNGRILIQSSNSAETQYGFMTVDTTGIKVELEGLATFRTADLDDSTAYINESYVNKYWVLDHIANAGGGTGTIGGSTGSTDNALLRADGTGGVTLQNSLITVNDAGEMTTPFVQIKDNGTASLIYNNTSVTGNTSGLWFTTDNGSGAAGGTIQFLTGSQGFDVNAVGGVFTRIRSIYGGNSGFWDLQTNMDLYGGSGVKTTIGANGTAGYLTVNTDGTTTVNNSLQTAYVAKTGTYTATASDFTINCTSGTFTVTLPTAAGITGRIYVVTNSGAGTITVGTTSSQTFANVSGTPTTLTMAAVGSRTVISNGANWLLIASL